MGISPFFPALKLSLAACEAIAAVESPKHPSQVRPPVIRPSPIATALRVAPLDLLNHDAENDDMGHIVERMRKQPEYVQKIMLKVRPLVEN